MLVFRALSLSLSITWRYILVFPVVLIGLGIFSLIALGVTLVLANVSPLLGVMVITSFTVAGTVLPVMIGTRLGLMTEGVRPKNGYTGLMVLSFAYGLFEGLSVWFMLAFAVGAFLFATPMTVDGIIGLWRLGTEVAYDALLLVDRAVTLAVTFGVAALIVGLRTLFLVGYASASVGMDPDDRSHSPFYGMGRGFVPQFLLVLLSLWLAQFIHPAAVQIATIAGLDTDLLGRFAMLLDAEDLEDAQEFGWDGVGHVFIYVVLILWVVSIQSAGAALVYMGVKTRYEALRKQEYAMLTGTYHAEDAKIGLLGRLKNMLPRFRRDDDYDDWD